MAIEAFVGDQRGRPAVFLDRDGTIAFDVPYCSRVEDFHLIPGVADAIARLALSGWAIVIITNQSGIARGFFSEETLDAIHKKMRADLSEAGTRIDGVYHCPHHPSEGCSCRKPAPGMILQAASELALDLGRSVMVGDSMSDVRAGQVAGCRTVLIRGDPPGDTLTDVTPDFVAKDFQEACAWIME